MFFPVKAFRLLHYKNRETNEPSSGTLLLPAFLPSSKFSLPCWFLPFECLLDTELYAKVVPTSNLNEKTLSLTIKNT
jgi:hypothetical protein